MNRWSSTLAQFDAGGDLIMFHRATRHQCYFFSNTLVMASNRVSRVAGLVR